MTAAPDTGPARQNPTCFHSFDPPLNKADRTHLHRVATEVALCSDTKAKTLFNEAIESLEQRPCHPQPDMPDDEAYTSTIRFSAALRVLRDLVLQGWTLQLDHNNIRIAPPTHGPARTDDPEAEKSALRSSFAFARDNQLAERSTSQFIHRMENQGIEAIFAQGSELAARLQARGTVGIQPELQLVTPEAQDEITGLRIHDIWRYARHSWSIPYQSTPGRNMRYLIRDRAVATRPLIGIAALGNPVLGLGERDAVFNWSITGLTKRLQTVSSEEENVLAAHLFQTLLDGVSTTYRDDLDLDPSPLANLAKTIDALSKTKKQSTARRLANIEASDDGHDADYQLIRKAQKDVNEGRAQDVDWKKVSTTALYRAKRAALLIQLYRAISVLGDLEITSHGGPLKQAMESSNGRRAVQVSLQRIKQEALASNVMDLITCGAVHPYRDILGGKLVALMMLSGEVVRDVKNRYGNRTSLIASAMAGQPYTRPADLTLLTTSSLYGAYGSSQYNRIRVDTPRGHLMYRRIAQTESYGTIQYARDTTAALAAAAQLIGSNRLGINHLFGEGTSPKLRLIRSGLTAIGLDSDAFLRHNTKRLLYGVELCSNTKDVVLGLSDEPDYLLDLDATGTTDLVQHWRTRWLDRRISRADIMDKLTQAQWDSFRLGNDIDRAKGQLSARAGPQQKVLPL